LDGTQSGSIKIAMGYQLPLVVSHVIVDPTILEYPIGQQIVPAGDATALAEAMQNTQLPQGTVKNGQDYSMDSWNNLISALTIGHNAKVNWS
jgi:hypothetical protein